MVGGVSRLWLLRSLSLCCVDQVSGDTEKKYSSVFFEKDADGRPKGDNVFAVDDAKQVRETEQTERACRL